MSQSGHFLFTQMLHNKFQTLQSMNPDLLLGQTIEAITKNPDGSLLLTLERCKLTVAASNVTPLPPNHQDENVNPKSYHFSGGNSAHGPLGFCARIVANTAEEAAETLESLLPATLKLTPESLSKGEYIEVYFNPTFDTTLLLTNETHEIEESEQENHNLQ
jgi:hypothetical protein